MAQNDDIQPDVSDVLECLISLLEEKNDEISSEFERTQDSTKSTIQSSSEIISLPQLEDTVTCKLPLALVICSFCRHVLHNAVSLSQCTHLLCAGCALSLRITNPSRASCPECSERIRLATYRYNRVASALAQSVVESNANLKRDEASLRALDEIEFEGLVSEMERYESHVREMFPGNFSSDSSASTANHSDDDSMRSLELLMGIAGDDGIFTDTSSDSSLLFNRRDESGQILNDQDSDDSTSLSDLESSNTTTGSTASWHRHLALQSNPVHVWVLEVAARIDVLRARLRPVAVEAQEQQQQQIQ